MQTANMFFFNLFTLTGLWFWVFVSAWVIVTFVDIYKERVGWATFWLVVLLVGFHLGGIVNVIDFIVNNPWKILGLFGAYISIGLVWTIAKFKMYLRKLRIRINDDIVPPLRKRFLEETGMDENLQTIPKHLIKFWEEKKSHNHELQIALVNMEVKNNKGRLALWAVWWPASIISTMIGDWITDMFNYLIFDVFGGLLGRIVNSEKAKISLD